MSYPDFCSPYQLVNPYVTLTYQDGTSLSYDLVLVSDSYSDYEIEDDNPVVGAVSYELIDRAFSKEICIDTGVLNAVSQASIQTENSYRYFIVL